MKKKIATILSALTIALTTAGCSNQEQTSTPSSEPETTSAIAVPTDMIIGEGDTAGKPLVQSNISKYINLTNEPSIKVTNIGDWKSYLTDFELPKNTYMVIDTKNTNRLIAAHVDDTSVAEIVLNNETLLEEEESTDYISFSTKTDFYVIMSDMYGNKELQHYKKPEDNSADVVDLADTITNGFTDNITFDSYKGEETIDGKTYDVIHCINKNNENAEATDLYFTKEGYFYKTITTSERMTTTIYEAGSITIPDEAWPDDDIETVQNAYAGITYGFILAMYDSDSQNATTQTAN